jgi:hypothetical protein
LYQVTAVEPSGSMQKYVLFDLFMMGFLGGEKGSHPREGFVDETIISVNRFIS